MVSENEYFNFSYTIKIESNAVSSLEKRCASMAILGGILGAGAAYLLGSQNSEIAFSFIGGEVASYYFAKGANLMFKKREEISDCDNFYITDDFGPIKKKIHIAEIWSEMLTKIPKEDKCWNEVACSLKEYYKKHKQTLTPEQQKEYKMLKKLEP